MGLARKSATKHDPARVTEILRIRIDGAQLHDVIAYAAEKQWGLTDAECAGLVEQADSIVSSRQDTNRRRVTAVHIARRETLYARAVNGADYRTALSCLADIAKLQGLYDRDHDKKELTELAKAQAERIRQLETRLSHGAVAIEPTSTGRGENAAEEIAGDGRETVTCRIEEEGTGRGEGK